MTETETQAPMLDRRLNAWRPDLAEARLIGVVAAERYVEGAEARITIPVADLRRVPDLSCGIDTQLLLGEPVRVLDTADGWCWVKADLDGYVGYLPEAMLSDVPAIPTHWVTAPRSFLYGGPDLKRPQAGALSIGSRLAVVGETETRGTRYLMLADGSAFIAGHCREIGVPDDTDFVAIAGRLVETPYLWGGRSGFGIDCSGLVQLSMMMMMGQSVPRDSDMQEKEIGHAIAGDDLRRGDLVFWKGHVGIMEDGATLLHANGLTMSVAREALDTAIARIVPIYGEPTGFRRP